MAKTAYRAGYTNVYATAGSSALSAAYDAAWEGTHAARSGSVKRRAERKAPARAERKAAAPVAVLLCLALAAVLGIALLSGVASISANRRIISSLEGQIRAVQAINADLNDQLDEVKDGMQVRNLAVNRLGMVLVQKEAVRTLRMPDTRPIGVPQAVTAQANEEEGFMGFLARLLRWINI